MTLGRRIALIPLLLFCVFSLSGCVNPYLWGAALLVAGTYAVISEGCPHGCAEGLAAGGGLVLCVVFVLFGIPALFRYFNDRSLGIGADDDDQEDG